MIAAGKVKTFADIATDSGKPLYRNLCKEYGIPMFSCHGAF
jgi:hypothetical protein